MSLERRRSSKLKFKYCMKVKRHNTDFTYDNQLTHQSTPLNLFKCLEALEDFCHIKENDLNDKVSKFTGLWLCSYVHISFI